MSTAVLERELGLGFDSTSVLTTLKNLMPKSRSNALSSDATLSNAGQPYYLISSSGEGVVVTFDFKRQAPLWLSETTRRLAQLINLQPDWNSYGARPVDLESISAALEVLLNIMGPDTPAPELVPTPRGTVQLEWHTHGIDLEIDVLSRGLYRLAFENLRTREVIEDLVTSDLNVIRNPIEILSSPPSS